jgi:hypothetical protein
MTEDEIKALEERIREEVKQQLQDDFLHKCIIDQNQDFLNQLREATMVPDAGLIFHLIGSRTTHFSRRLALDYAISCAHECNQKVLAEWLEHRIIEFPEVFGGEGGPPTPPEDEQKTCIIS